MSKEKGIWNAQANKIKEAAKWIKKGTMVNVDLRIDPSRTTVKGRFGDREVYIVYTADFGNVYVTPIQLLHICELAKGDFSGVMTAELI